MTEFEDKLNTYPTKLITASITYQQLISDIEDCICEKVLKIKEHCKKKANCCALEFYRNIMYKESSPLKNNKYKVSDIKISILDCPTNLTFLKIWQENNFQK